MRYVLAIIAGIFIGGIVNMGLIGISASIIPPPDGVDPSDIESIKANIHLYEPQHFLFPFLAHALGTLVGALVAALVTTKHKMRLALGIGAFYLLGGIGMSLMVPAPAWFIALDLLGAYLPMGWIGGKLATRKA